MIKLFCSFIVFGILIVSNLSYATPFNMLFSSLSRTKIIVLSGSGRSWSDGSFAKTCNEYKNPNSGYSYRGIIGNGAYTINPNGTPFIVYCDMTTDGGGWTLVVAGRGQFSGSSTGGNALLNATSSNSHICLTGSDVSNCPNNALYWIPKNISATSYLKKMGNYALVVKMKSSAIWSSFISMKQTDPNLDYTYKPTSPSIHFLGYSLDSSGEAGCQDAAIFYTYLFAIGDGNIPCGGSYSLLYNELTTGYGFLDSVYGNGSPGQIFIR